MPFKRQMSQPQGNDSVFVEFAETKPIHTSTEIAKIAGVSPRTVEQHHAITTHAPEPIRQAVSLCVNFDQLVSSFCAKRVF